MSSIENTPARSATVATKKMFLGRFWLSERDLQISFAVLWIVLCTLTPFLYVYVQAKYMPVFVKELTGEVLAISGKSKNSSVYWASIHGERFSCFPPKWLHANNRKDTDCSGYMKMGEEYTVRIQYDSIISFSNADALEILQESLPIKTFDRATITRMQKSQNSDWIWLAFGLFMGCVTFFVGSAFGSMIFERKMG